MIDRTRLAVFVIALLASMTAAAQVASPDPLVNKGRRLFLQCSACHEIADTTIVKMGPNLKGIVGRQVASLPGYTYSESLKSSSFVWDEAQLDRWIQQPTQIAPGTTMAFIGLPKEEDRRAVIAYLKTLR